MATLKDHQATMVSMLASGTAIPTSAIRLAHALHDVLSYLNDTNAAPVAHTERRIDATTPGLNDMMLAEAIKTCSGKIMDGVQKQSEDFAARFNKKNIGHLVDGTGMFKSSEQSLESLLKQRDNTIRQLKARVADLKLDYADLEQKLKESQTAEYELKERLSHAERCWRAAEREVINSMAPKANESHVVGVDFIEPAQAGCRKEDTQLLEDGWIEWGGGVCPVAENTVVCVKFRDGDIDLDGAVAGRMDWAHSLECYDIIAYRITGEAK